MDEIKDITFNFKLLKEMAFKAVENFNNAFDSVCDKKALYDRIQKPFELNNAPDFFKEFYVAYINDNGEAFHAAKQKAFVMLKSDLIEALAKLRVEEKCFKNTIDVVTSFLQARVDFIESTHSQDELYANYRLREERNNLKKEIKQYVKIAETKLKESGGFTLE